MPIYEYQCQETEPGCPKCHAGFTVFQSLRDAVLTQCPSCGSRIRKCLSVCAVGRSASSLDDRARRAGFSKLKRLGKGEYEKQY